MPIQPVFRPSTCTRVTATLTAPGTLATAGVVAGSLLLGASLPVVALAGGAFVAGSRLFSKIITGGEVMRSALFFVANRIDSKPLSYIEGGFVTKIAPLYLKILKEMRSEKAQKAHNALQSAIEFEHCFNDLGIANGYLIQDLLNYIQKLVPGQKVALSLGYKSIFAGGHVIIASIERQEEGKFTLHLHNQGENSGYHPDNQSTLTVSDIEEKNLAVFIRKANSLRTLHMENMGSSIYTALLLLKGTFQGASKDPKDKQEDQNGNSCSGYSIRCFLKTVLSQETFNELEERIVTTAIETLRKGIEESFLESGRDHRMVHNALVALRPELNLAPIDMETTSWLTLPMLLTNALFWHFYFHSPMLRETGKLLGNYIDTEEKIDPGLFMEALENKNVPRSFLKLPKTWARDKKKMYELIQQHPRLVHDVSQELANDPDFIESLLLQMCSKGDCKLSLTTGDWSTLYKDKSFALKMIAKDPRVMRYWFQELRKDPDIKQALFAQRSLEGVKTFIKLYGTFEIPPESLENPDVCLEVLLHDPEDKDKLKSIRSRAHYQTILRTLIENRPTLLVALKGHQSLFQDLPPDLRGNLDVVRLAIEHSRYNLQHASQEIQTSKEALLELIEIEPWVYDNLAEDNPLRDDRDIAWACTQKHGYVPLSDKFLDDPELLARSSPLRHKKRLRDLKTQT